MSSAWTGLANNRLITELPHYAVNKKLPTDSFYTTKKTAQYCMDVFYQVVKDNNLDISNHIFIEPSAGEGSFHTLLPKNSIGLDIQPRAKNIQKADFLSWWPGDDSYVCVGNPPFGHRGAMALAFVNRALLFADIVAFILPMSFYSNGKGSNMKRVSGAALVHSEKLPPDIFYTPEDKKPASVNTVFQVWVKGIKSSIFLDYDVSEYVEIYTCCSAPDRYCGLGKGRNYDCFVASSFYGNELKIVKDFADVLYGSGYGLIIKKNKQEIMEVLNNTNWTNYCSDATNHCKHVRMYHIRKLLGDNGFGKEV